MNSKDSRNSRPENTEMQELNLDELEDVSGGGIKEIVAATTLAAMAMTGQTVSAFGLANAMAEGSVRIEEAPEQELYGAEYAGVMANSIEEVAIETVDAQARESSDELGADVPDPIPNEELPADEEEAAEVEQAPAAETIATETIAVEALPIEAEDALDMTAEGEEAVAITPAEDEEEAEEAAEVPAEVEMDLDAPEETPDEGGEFTLGDDEAETGDAVDRAALMELLIDSAVEARQDEGLYAALDSSFATLAENADVLANPETGLIETDGSRIVNLTYDALSSRFDVEPERLMSAIGAAAFRADEAGYLQALGGDRALVSLAASSQTNADVMKYTNSYFGSLLDAISLASPGFKPFVPLLKTLAGDIFSTDGNANAQVLNKLNDIEKQIQDAESSLMRSTYNVVSLQSIGDKYSSVRDRAEHVQEQIGNIAGNTALSDAQRLQQLADLKNDSEFRALESAMDGATNCFTSNVNDIFERQSIFDAAYARACESVMFSREAIDISIPYITRQFAVYCAAYGVMNQVYSAYEQVYGAASLTATRQKMAQRLGGVDASGNNVGGSVTEAIKNYCARDKFLFVDKGSCSIALDRAVNVWQIRGKIGDTKFNEINTIANQAKAIPVSKGQMEDICRYAASKGRSLFNFLFNDMQFAPAADRNLKLGNDPAKIQKQLDNQTFAFDFDELTQTWDEGITDVWFLNGQQSMPDKRDGNDYCKVANLINGRRVGIEKKDDKQMAVWWYVREVYLKECGQLDLLILQGR